jgi:GTPase SAR1 family protein
LKKEKRHLSSSKIENRSAILAFVAMSSTKKVVLVGHRGCVKTSLYNCISGEKFKSAYEPTVSNEREESYQKNISVKRQKVINYLIILER